MQFSRNLLVAAVVGLMLATGSLAMAKGGTWRRT